MLKTLRRQAPDKTFQIMNAAIIIKDKNGQPALVDQYEREAARR